MNLMVVYKFGRIISDIIVISISMLNVFIMLEFVWKLEVYVCLCIVDERVFELIVNFCFCCFIRLFIV